MNYFDPVNSGCNYTITESTWGITPPRVDGSEDCPTLLSFSNEDVIGIHRSATQITIANGTHITGATVFAAPVIKINGSFEVEAGSCIDFSDKGCQYSGTIDCERAVSTAGSCSDPYEMFCGTILQGNTGDNSSIWSSYGINTG